MSYNISDWKTKRLENLVIPMKAFYIYDRKDWHPTFEFTIEGNDVEVARLQDFEFVLEGIVKGETEETAILKVSDIDITGEGSGTFMSWILVPALKQSTGILEAVLIWEGGDSITRLSFNDGEFTEEEIEL